MYSSSITPLIWCCHSSPCPNRLQPTAGRNSWLCFKAPGFTCIGNCMSWAEFTDVWPHETMCYCYSTTCSPPDLYPAKGDQTKPNQNEELSDLPALVGQFTQEGDSSCKYTHLQAHSSIMRLCPNPGIPSECIPPESTWGLTERQPKQTNSLDKRRDNSFEINQIADTCCAGKTG